VRLQHSQSCCVSPSDLVAAEESWIFHRISLLAWRYNNISPDLGMHRPRSKNKHGEGLPLRFSACALNGRRQGFRLKTHGCVTRRTKARPPPSLPVSCFRSVWRGPSSFLVDTTSHLRCTSANSSSGKRRFVRAPPRQPWLWPVQVSSTGQGDQRG
jgi:hypothetical protein